MTFKDLKRSATDAASSTAGTAVASAATAMGLAKEQLEKAAPGVVDKAVVGAKTISAPMSAAATAAYSKATDRFDQIRSQYKALLAAWLVQKIQKHTERLVNKLPGMLKNYLEDPDMPRVVARGKDRIIDGVWPDFREEIMWEIAVMLDRQKEDPTDNYQGPDCFRRFFRYHIHPCDKSVWGKLRDPVYIGFFLCSCLPVSAASPAAFLFLFLILDKTDEYQLVFFILWFKGMQFFTHGVLRTMLGFFLYFACVTVPRRADDHGCENLGPGLAGNFELILGGWVLQVILVWFAWALLRCSKDKGRSELKGRIEHQHTGVQKMGGYLRIFLLYDLVCFIILCVLLVAIFILGPGSEYNEWPVGHALFACQVLYGYVSMPFFFFTLPVFQSVLTHAIPTAYDRQGRCVQWKGPPKPKKEKKEDLNANDFVNNDETNTLLDKMKVLFSGGTVELPQEWAKTSGTASSSSTSPVVVGGILLQET